MPSSAGLPLPLLLLDAATAAAATTHKAIVAYQMSDSGEDESVSGDGTDDSADEWSADELFALKTSREFVEALDHALDPFELFHAICFDGLPPRVMLALRAICFDRSEMTFPPEISERADAVFHDFLVFTQWGKTSQRGHQLPDDWFASRSHIEHRWPLRGVLMRQLRRVIDKYCIDQSDRIVAFYAAKQRWRRLRSFPRVLGVVSFWVHMANRPGSAGYRSAVRAAHGLIS